MLVAFVIEFDNEAERQIRATGSSRLFLVSMPMWSNDLRFVPAEGVAVGRLASLSSSTVDATRNRLNAYARWRYVEVLPGDDDDRARPPLREWIVRPLPAGRMARKIWRPLVSLVEERWRVRFGETALEDLRGALAAIVREFASDMPYDVPILGYGFHSEILPRAACVPERDDLPALLSQALNAIARAFGEEPGVSLALAQNVLRLVAGDDVRPSEIPLRAGIAREATAVALGYLERSGLASIESDPGAKRGRIVRATTKGKRAYERAHARLARIENEWSVRSAQRVVALRDSLTSLLDARVEGRSRLGSGLEPAPGGWRSRAPYAIRTKAMIADPHAALPYVPLVLHRGGWPDGS